MKTLKINTSKQYFVTIGQNLDFAQSIKVLSESRRTVVVSDDIVWELYGEAFTDSLIKAGFEVSAYIMPHGEENKNLEIVSEIAQSFSDYSLTRTDFAIALGGGIVGDCCGFASSIYLRGIDYIQIPTTFLAAIDSSVGGKTGVNTEYGKNLLGAFHQPMAVFCDTDFFDTLPDEIFTAGACEALKYGLLRNPSLFCDIKKDKRNIEEIVFECVKIKAEIVAADEFERKTRRLLNFGHTFGHAIEKASDYSVSHGHAVGLGMMIAAKAAENLGICEIGLSDEIKKKLVYLNIDTDLSSYKASELCEYILSDKKRKGREIELVLPEALGECFLYKTEIDNINDIVQRGLK